MMGGSLRLPPASGQEVVLPWRLVPAGGFTFGCTSGDAECFPDELPARAAAVAAEFEMLATEVTVAQFRSFLRATGGASPPAPSFVQTDSDPVINVTWSDAEAFCRWIGGRLPGEAEWEYAARGGRAASRYPNGDTIDLTQANFAGTGGTDTWTNTAPVASFPGNGYGLFDMAGNVWEWCADGYAADRGAAGSGRTSAPAEFVRLRVMRGGAWDCQPRSLRVSNRGRAAPTTRLPTTGFRCVRDGGAGAPGADGTETAPVEVSGQDVSDSAGAVPSDDEVAPVAAAGTTPARASSRATAGPHAVGERRRFAPTQAEMAWLPAGAFEMGCVLGDADCDADEQPRHEVSFSSGYWLDTTEVTVARFERFAAAVGAPLPRQPEWSGMDHPIVNVTWSNAEAYCRWAGGRLPSEAEWEYAARGGVGGEKFPGGRGFAPGAVNGDGTSSGDRWEKTAPVASFPPNGYGLYDMLGNVWEWCADWYDPRAYSAAVTEDPAGPPSGRERVVRGASWTSVAGRMRISYRFRLDPADASLGVGFRCARDGTP